MQWFCPCYLTLNIINGFNSTGLYLAQISGISSNSDKIPFGNVRTNYFIGFKTACCYLFYYSNIFCYVICITFFNIFNFAYF